MHKYAPVLGEIEGLMRARKNYDAYGTPLKEFQLRTIRKCSFPYNYLVKKSVPASIPEIPRGPGRPREFDMDGVLSKAVLVFRERGYHAASINELVLAMGLTEGSLYKAFKNKRQLFSAAFDHYCSARQAGLRACLPTDVSGRAQLHAALHYYADSSSGREGQRGCLIVASLSVLDLLEVDLADQVVQALRHSESALAELIRIGQEDGSIDRSIEASGVSTLMWHLLLGMRVAGKTGRTRKSLHAVVDLAMGLLV